MRQLILADDSKTIQKVVRLSFDNEEFEVHCFSSGMSALEHLRTHGGDIVLADVALSSLDGYDLCREIKEHAVTASIPVILLANTFRPFNVERAVEVGSDGYLTKPFETGRLVNLVESLLEMPSLDTESSDEDTLETNSTLPASFEDGKDARSFAGEEGRDLILTLPGPSGLERSFLKLSIEQCRSPVAFPERVVMRSDESPAAVEPLAGGTKLSDEDLQALVEQVMHRLPEALRELVPAIARDVLKG